MPSRSSRTPGSPPIASPVRSLGGSGLHSSARSSPVIAMYDSSLANSVSLEDRAMPRSAPTAQSATLRPATADDLAAVEKLLSASGLPRAGVADALPTFLVAQSADGLVGVAGLRSEEHTSE